MPMKKREEFLEAIKSGFIKPSDLQNQTLLFGPEITPVLFTPILGSERGAYEEGRLHVEGFKRKFTNERKYSNERRKPNFNQREKLVSWVIKEKESEMGPFTKNEMIDKMRNNLLNGTMIKRIHDAFFFSYDDFKKESKNTFNDEREVDDFILRIKK